MSSHKQQSARNGGQPFGWADLGTGESVELARPLARLGARIIDWIIQYVPMVVYLVWAVATNDYFFGSGDDAPVQLLLFATIWFVGYEVVQIAVWGQTIGKRMARIKVIRTADGGVPGWGKAISRWIIPLLPAFISFATLGSTLGTVIGPIAYLLALLCYISLTWDRAFQGWHDKAARTLVVRV